VLHAALRDLFHRRRRYLISTIGCGLVFAMSLIMTGLADSFAGEWHDAVELLGAERFIVADGVDSPFTGMSPIEASTLPVGVEPFVYAVQTAVAEDTEVIALFGVPAGGPFEPKVAEGRQLESPGEVLVSRRSSHRPGSTVRVGGSELAVVGVVDGFSVNGGMAGMAVAVEDAQGIVFRGLPLVSAGVVATGSDVTGLDGTTLDEVSATAAVEDALRIVESARQSISFMRALLWAVAGLIVGSVIFLSVIERLRDFALFKAIGASTRDIAGGVVMQSAVLALSSALIGVVLGLLLAPVFPLPVQISTLALVGLPALGLAVGVLASLFGLRRVLRVEPALAFGGAA